MKKNILSQSKASCFSPVLDWFSLENAAIPIMNPPDQNALAQSPQIDFTDDRDDCLLQVTVARKLVEELDLVKSDAHTTPSLKGHSDHLLGHDDPINDFLNEIRKTPDADYATLARVLRISEATVKRNIQKLKQQDRIHPVGSKKTGHWKIVE